MKRKISLVLAAIMASGGMAFAADAAATWNTHCAACHGKDGSGNTLMGKKWNIKDYRDPKVQAGFTDAQATEIIENGKEKMKGFKGKLSDDQIKALVAYIRAFKK
jgi:mono/diheme cytochrome c family protein